MNPSSKDSKKSVLCNNKKITHISKRYNNISNKPKDGKIEAI